mgnify:CR=1 FL=1
MRDDGRGQRLWRGSVLEVKLQRFLEIGERLLQARALAGHIDLKALRHEPGAFTDDRCGKPHEPKLPSTSEKHKGAPTDHPTGYHYSFFTSICAPKC